MSWFSRLKFFIFRSNMRATKILIIFIVLVFFLRYILDFLVPGLSWLVFALDQTSIPSRPWSLLTYPLFNIFPFALVFGALALWLFGGGLEAIWGTKKYLVRLAAITVITGAGLWLASRITGGAYLGGIYVIITPLIVAWAAYNPGQIIMFSFIFPVEAKWMAWIAVFLQLFSIGPFWMGLFSLSGCLYSYYISGYHGKSYSSGSVYGSRISWRDRLLKYFRRKNFKKIK